MRKLVSHPLLLVLPLAGLLALAAAAVPPPNLERALAAQRALAQKQPTAEVWNDLGNLLQLAGRNDEARDAYEKALERDSKLVSAHYNLGLLQRSAGKERQAMQHFEEVVELDPGHAWGWFQLGALNEARGAQKAAVDDYARAYALDARLSFGDVNPQVIDSRLTTEALLRAQEKRPAAAEAPRAYEDPRHIAKLLLPQAPPAAAGTTPPPPGPGEPAVAAVPGQPGAPATPRLPADQRVLTPQDLRAGSQVGGVTSGGQLGGQPGGRAQPQPNPAYSDLLRQQLEFQQEQQRQMEEGGGVAEPTAEGVYVPGVRSSGQISQTIEEWREG